jgi:uncharacterized protein (DUF952 family)
MMTDPIRRIYHITSKSAWDAAQSRGFYEVESLHTQGFIHLSKVDQVLRVANAIYTGQNDLILLEVDSSRLTAELRYEPPDTMISAEHQDEETFPHLYGTLNVDAVTQIHDFLPNTDSTFQLPGGIMTTDDDSC